MRRRIQPVPHGNIARRRWLLLWVIIITSTSLLSTTTRTNAIVANDLDASTNLSIRSFTRQPGGGLTQTNSNVARFQGFNSAVTLNGTNATHRPNNLRTGYTPATTLASTTSMRPLTSSSPTDLIVWWTCEEGGGTTLGDATGNGYSGSLLGDPLPLWTKGVTSDALSFDCAQNFVGSDQPISQTVTAATLECWFLADYLSGESPPLVGTFQDDNPVYGQGDIGSLLIFNPDVRPDLGYRISFSLDSNLVAAPVNALDGRYHHVAGVWDGAQMRLYYDGELVATTNATIGPVEANCYLRAGYRNTNGGCFLGGIIGETRLYDRALSSDEVAADYNTDTVGDGIPDWWRLQYFGSGTATDHLSCAACDPNQDGHSNLQEYQNGTDPMAGIAMPSNLSLWWTFEEGSGRGLLDASGNGHSGSLVGDPPSVWTNGVTSGGLSFDCAQNYISSDQPISQTFTAATLECWFLADCLSGESPPLVGTFQDDNPVYGQGDIGSLLIFNPDVRPDLGYRIYFSLDSHELAAPINAFDGQYHHVASVWDGEQIRLYYDGELVAATNTSISPVEANCYLRAGYRNTNGGCFLGGIIGETRLYDRALSSDEVAADYNTDTLGDGIPDWWRQRYFGSGTTTNSSSCAACDPDGDGFTNLQEYQNGTDPLVSNAITVPALVRASSTDNPASVTDLRAGASYSWSIDNGTITAGDGTPNVTWSAGDAGMATLSVSLQATNASPFGLSALAQVQACSLSAVILTPPEVRVGSTNIASVPSPFITVASYNNGWIEGITQGSDSNFYGRSSEESDERIFRITPQGTFTTVWVFNNTSDITNGYAGSTAAVPVKGRGTNDPSLYGVNTWGGLTFDWSVCFGSGPYYGFGTVFKLTPQGATTNLTTLHVFTGSFSNADGALPGVGLVQGTGGDTNGFYGVTSAGGTNVCTLPWGCCIVGYGTVFRAGGTSTNGYSVLHRFSGGIDGAYPNDVCLGADGFLYGSTTYGGTNSDGTAYPGTDGFGTVFKISTNGSPSTFRVLHQFSGADAGGANPIAAVIETTNGFVYGTTSAGGTSGLGTVFQVDTNGNSFSTLHSFNGLPGDFVPNSGLVQAYDGNLYGTTMQGGAYTNGTIFRLSPQGTFTNFTDIYQFRGIGDGNWPNWGGEVPSFSLNTFDGYLYGATIGTLFKYLPATYGWSITNGMIIGPTNTPSIQWTPTGTNTVTICVTIVDSPVCSVSNVCVDVRPVTGAIAAGEFHSLALTPDGTVWAWGGNGSGQLGDGTTGDKLVPTALSSNLCNRAPISNVVAMAGGDAFSVAADAMGRVWTWGDNDSLGALGNGTNYGQTSSPVPIAGVSNVVAVAAGWRHTLALRGDGTVWAWGSDEDNGSDVTGQLGLGDPPLYATNAPARSLVPPPVVAIAGGLLHSAAVRADGTVWTWGLGGEGQLGNGGTDSTNIPVRISGISNVVSIAAGDLHTVALTWDRKVWTWGYNGSGQLGWDADPDNPNPTPGLVTGLTNLSVMAVAAGNGYTLAVATNGQLFAWGDNSYGQLGTNVAAVPSTNAPMRVPGISNVVMVAAADGSDGGAHTLAVTVEHGTNRYWAWGRNDVGQVGNGTNGAIQSSPQQLVFPCVQYIQLGTGGTFQAQCTGTLMLYFNDDYFTDNSGVYTVTVSGVASQVIVEGTNSQGVAVGTVYNGSNYTYSASGFCDRGNGDLTDANGNDSDGNPVGCAVAGCTPSNTPCPCAIGESLVGKITTP